MTATDVRALLFDTFGTVVDWRAGLISSMQAWGLARGITADWPGLADAWRAAYVPSMAKVRTGERGWADLDVLQRESVEILAPEFGAVGLDGAALDELVRMWHALPPWPDSVQGLSRLRTRFVIAPLSNGHVALLVRLAKTAGITWDAVFGADVFRHYKPDPETYLGATGLLGCEPSQVMLVAAHASDLDAAARCGLRTCHVSRPWEYGPGRVVEKPEARRFDVMVDDLQELAQVMGC
ncbi:MAG TPA: haloacid dehalogenase type II [Mycobacterium sp.]|nr:haloacid dehalogenase type II [Mycobacterium sp.]